LAGGNGTKAEFDAKGKAPAHQRPDREITPTKKSEDALAERNLQLSLVERLHWSAAIPIDLGTDVIMCLRAMSPARFARGDHRDDAQEWRARAHPKMSIAWRSVVGNAFVKRINEYDIEYRIIRSERTLRWIVVA
jgi:hypothetical protein